MTQREASPVRLELAGFCLVFVGLGLARFGYPPLIPVMVAHGTLTPAGAGYMAAANFAGYLAGALAADPSARRLGPRPVMLAALVAAVASFVACGVDLGLGWLGFWRCVAGISGGLLMVMVPPVLLPLIPVALRPRAGGRLFAAVGAGMLVSGLLLPLMPQAGPGTLWLLIALLGAVAGIAGFALLPRALGATAAAADRRESVAAAGEAPRFGRAFWGLGVLYAAIAMSYIPHTVFWVDFLARDRGAGLGAGGAAWMLFGLGALLGPQALGRLAGRFGYAPTLRASSLGLVAALLLPIGVDSETLLSATSVLAGACAIGSVSLVSGRSNAIVAPERRARAWAILTVGFAVMQGAGAWLLSVVLSVTHSYTALFVTAAGVLLAGLLADALLGRDARAAR
ncbi:MAG: YbfB/YjiJ family MFS transporter [Burkholderiales bacterium]|jgi:MFS family permease|nr:YbfB/YjiJ family MFS transporter [Burkholderiales bacterium]